MTNVMKLVISFTTGMIFWFLVFLVYMVYSFLPPDKIVNSIIFTLAAPALYLLGMHFLFKKLFKDSGWRQNSVNILITITMTGLSLFIMDMMSKILY